MTKQDNRQQKLSELEKHLGYWMRYVSNHVSGTFQKRLASCDVTVAEWAALRIIYSIEPCTLKEVSESLGMTGGAVSRLVERLVNAGLAKRSAGVEDRRSVSICLTSEGRALVPQLAKYADDNDEHFFGHLSQTERNQMLKFLKNLVAKHKLREKPLN